MGLILEIDNGEQVGLKNPVYRQTEVSFKQLTQCGQPGVENIANQRAQKR